VVIIIGRLAVTTVTITVADSFKWRSHGASCSRDRFTLHFPDVVVIVARVAAAGESRRGRVAYDGGSTGGSTARHVTPHDDVIARCDVVGVLGEPVDTPARPICNYMYRERDYAERLKSLNLWTLGRGEIGKI